MKVYEYNTFHFRPVRKWRQGELDMTLRQIRKFLFSDAPNRKFFSRNNGGFYRYADFYAAMCGSDAVLSFNDQDNYEVRMFEEVRA